jgi:hypothetical protein
MFALTKLVASAALLISVLGPVNAAVITLSDGNFVEGTWSTFDSSDGNGFASASRASSGGNPDHYISTQTAPPDGIGAGQVYFFSQVVSWNPQAHGPLESVRLSFDARTFVHTFSLVGLHIRQNGSVYGAAELSHFYTTSAWTSYSSAVWTRADFSPEVDFSASGAPIYFGFSVSDTIWEGSVGVDNFTATLNVADVAPVPEPGTWAMLSLGLVGLAFWRRKA